MFEKIVPKITVDVRANRPRDLRKVDDADVQILQFYSANRNRFDLCERDRNFSPCALSFPGADDFKSKPLCQILREQGGAGPRIKDEIERTAIVYLNWQQNERLRTARETKSDLRLARRKNSGRHSGSFGSPLCDHSFLLSSINC